MAVNARYFCKEIMDQHHFNASARDLILAGCDFQIDDPFSLDGGGFCKFGYGGIKTLVHLNTGQHEAAVHELAHAWWYLIEIERPRLKDFLVKRLLDYGLKQAVYGPGFFPVVRGLCRVYRDGDGRGWHGMWITSQQRYNHDEWFAGLASGTMGDMAIMPPPLRRIYRLCFDIPESVYMPAVHV